MHYAYCPLALILNRDPCVVILQRTIHNASPCCVRVRMPCLSGFFSDLYSNVVMLVQDCFLPYTKCKLKSLQESKLFFFAL